MKVIALLVAFLIILPLTGATGEPMPQGPYQGNYLGQPPYEDQFPGQPPYEDQFPGQPPYEDQFPGQSPYEDQFPGQPPYEDQFPGQPPYEDQYPEQPGPASSGQVQYSIQVPSDVPVPAAPISPQALTLEAPTTPTSFAQTPSEESGVALYMADKDAAYSVPAGMSAQPLMAQMIMPPGIPASNRFYVSYAPQTVASCYFYGYLPTWLHIYNSGKIWGYEWYPDGHLSVRYLGYAFPGWNKRWFQGDMAGWHILQYYCSGWSNYIYIYVYGGPGPWTPGPWP